MKFSVFFQYVLFVFTVVQGFLALRAVVPL